MDSNQLTSVLSHLAELCEIKFDSNKNQKNNESFFAIPGLRNAKYLLPIKNGYRAYRNGLELYPAINRKLIAKKCLAASLWPITYFPNFNNLTLYSINLQNVSKNFYDLLSENRKNIDYIKSFSVRIGSAGKGFKLIFQFQEDNGNIISYIKVGDSDHRGKFLLNEKKQLEYLQNFQDIIIVPEVLGYKENAQFTALELTAIEHIQYYPIPEPNDVARVLAELCNQTNSYQNNKNDVAEKCNKYFTNEKLRRLIKGNNEFLELTKLPCPLVHRDLGGWNLFCDKNGKIGMLDWEFAKQKHLPFQDLFHYFLHTTIHNSHYSPIQAYQYVFKENENYKQSIKTYAEIIKLDDPDIIRNLKIAYLWDWFTFEQSRAVTNIEQGREYLEILNWIAEHENCN